VLKLSFEISKYSVPTHNFGAFPNSTLSINDCEFIFACDVGLYL